MSTINDGGRAFPRPASIGNNYMTGEEGVVVDPQAGMSLRDYFAAKAMAAMISNHDFYEFMAKAADNESRRCGGSMSSHIERGIAKLAFAQADAMLAARTKTD